MRKILVTGAYGQLGSELKLLSEGYSGFEFILTDYDSLNITDPSAVTGFMVQHKPDYVINCAAYTSVDKAEKEREACFLLNAVAPSFLAAGCHAHGSRLIHISTDYVFDGTASVPYKEDDPVNPMGVYGSSKLEGERACLKFPESVIIRTSWLYSAFGHNFVKTILRLGREKEELNVVFDQVGSPTWAADLAGAILELVKQSTDYTDAWKPGIYHYSGEGVCSWYDFASVILRLSDVNCRISAVETKDFITLARRPAYSVLNKSKIKNNFQLTIPHWMDSLENCLTKLNKNEIWKTVNC
jgi:dTDP-4-dehydrorhamnose reductase